MNYHWNWKIFLATSPDGTGTYWQSLLHGLQWTIYNGICAWIMALIFGLAVGVLTTINSKIMRRIAFGYVEVFRNIPLLVQMFLWYFVVPELLPSSLGLWVKGVPYSSFLIATICLGFFTSARVAVQIAAGIESLPPGQMAAAKAMGFTTLQTYRYVLLPVAVRRIFPTLTNELINCIKNTSVALTIGLMELTAAARAMEEFSYQIFEAFTAATVLYIFINLTAIAAMRALEYVLDPQNLARWNSSKEEVANV